MLDISKLKNRNALVKLKEYNGSNEYLISLKNRIEKEGSFFISPSVAEYIELNFDICRAPAGALQISLIESL